MTRLWTLLTSQWWYDVSPMSDRFLPPLWTSRLSGYHNRTQIREPGATLQELRLGSFGTTTQWAVDLEHANLRLSPR